MQKANIGKAFLGGLIATAITFGLMYLGPLLGISTWNLAGMTGAALGFGKNITSANALWDWGLIVDLIFMLFVLPLCYAHWVYSWLRGPNAFRGMLWGWFMWFLQQMLIMPLIGKGIFDRNGTGTASEIISWFVLWTIYGVVFGVIAGPQRIWQSYLKMHPDQAHTWPHPPSRA
jgi:hypothetical protein